MAKSPASSIELEPIDRLEEKLRLLVNVVERLKAEYASGKFTQMELARRYGVPLDRAHILGHDEVPGISPARQKSMHWDPGPYWDWDRYMKLLRAADPVTPDGDPADEQPDTLTDARAPGAVVFIADRDHHVLGSNDRAVAQALIQGASWTENSSILRQARDAAGNNWRFSEIALQGGPLFIGYAMKESALFSATYLSVATDFLTPVLMIMLAWTAIWFATEQQVTRWILYLRRISAAYRGGHYAIRPSLAGAPSEFTALGQGFSDMANSIQDRDQRLRDAVEQKSVLIREIHHRVKNNLQQVAALARAAQRTPDTHVKPHLNQAKERKGDPYGYRAYAVHGQAGRRCQERHRRDLFAFRKGRP